MKMTEIINLQYISSLLHSYSFKNIRKQLVFTNKIKTKTNIKLLKNPKHNKTK